MNRIELVVGPDEPENVEFGEILRGFRTMSGLARSQAALRIGVTSEYIRLMEKGERTPALGTALKILENYGIPHEVNITRSQLIFENTLVEFTSRIKEARGANVPELRYYTVTEEREVKVSANNPKDAAVLADSILSGETDPVHQTNVQAWPRKTTLYVREDR